MHATPGSLLIVGFEGQRDPRRRKLVWGVLALALVAMLVGGFFVWRSASGSCGDGDVTVADSNAILVYLARQYGAPHWLPTDPAIEAQVQRWLTVAAGLVAYGPCAARLLTVFKMQFNAEEVIARAHALFAVMEQELAERPWLVAGDMPTIADVANYTYIAHAPEGNVSLDAYPAIRAWLARVEALPGFFPMPVTAAGLRA